MKSSLTKIDTRRSTIVGLLTTTEDLTLDVNQLAEKMKVSPMTIRRDLDVLEKMGKIIRHHGKATLNQQQSEEGDTENESIERIKIRLAQHASTYIENNMTLFINSSSTALGTVDFLEDKIVTLVTNNLQVNRRNVNPNSTVMLPGGEIRFPKEALVGDLCVTNLSKIHSDISVIGCSGISAAKGITTNNIHESKVNNVMISNTEGLVVVVCDYRKVGFDGKFIVSNLSNVDVLITDVYANPTAIRDLESAGVSVIQVGIE